MLLLPLFSLTLPGLLAYVLGRRFRSVWPGVVLALVALGSGIFFLSQASGAGWNDGSATNHVLAAFAISFPALMSSAVGATFARMRGR